MSDLDRVVDRILADALPAPLREALDAGVAAGATLRGIKAAASHAGAGPLLLAGVEVYAREAMAALKERNAP